MRWLRRQSLRRSDTATVVAEDETHDEWTVRVATPRPLLRSPSDEFSEVARVALKHRELVAAGVVAVVDEAHVDRHVGAQIERA